MKQLFFSCILILFSATTFAQVTNLDFEDWHNDTTGNIKLNSWKHFTGSTDHSSAGSMLGTWRMTNSYHGAYSLKISRWYASAYDHVFQTASFNQRPYALSGYYFYEDANLSPTLADTTIHVKDTAIVNLTLTKWNTGSNMADTIGDGKAYLTEASVYSFFSCIINYRSASNPDTIILHIQPTTYTVGSSPVCPTGGSCSYLTIDELRLDATAGIQSVSLENELQIYPNPVSNMLYIENKLAAKAILSNCIGMSVSVVELKAGSNEINMEGLPAGIYFISVMNRHYRVLKF